ncbi:MAG: cation transporter [Bernardetiaceae bacterium]|nr:cation transporter [Bernardetiaceae bacterium]
MSSEEAREKQREVESAAWIAIWGNALLAIAKIVVGIIAGSLAVVGDGIDSSSDILTSSIVLFSSRLMRRKPNARYPFGFRKSETLGAKLLSFVIFFAGAQLFISSISVLWNDAAKDVPSFLAIYVTILSIVAKWLLAWHQAHIGKKHKNKVLIANAQNMRSDVLISASVLIGLFFTYYLEMPIFDSLTALAVSLWIIRTAIGIYIENSFELMDGMKQTELYAEVIYAVEQIQGAENPHRIRIRKLGEAYLISLDIEVDAQITVAEAHVIAKMVEDKIRARIDNVYDILTHIEPLENEEEEQFGISRKSLDK